VVLKAAVKNGRILVDEPTDLPEGTVLDLVIENRKDEMSPAEIAALNAALDKSWAQAEAGQLIPVAEVLEKMRNLHKR
jgi:hypothetical protein